MKARKLFVQERSINVMKNDLLQKHWGGGVYYTGYTRLLANPIWITNQAMRKHLS